jgi:hypothetical protein
MLSSHLSGGGTLPKSEDFSPNQFSFPAASTFESKPTYGAKPAKLQSPLRIGEGLSLQVLLGS